MCAVSMVSDYGSNISVDTWTHQGWKEYQELIKKAQEFDKIMHQPHCEDPNKEKWMKEVEERILRLEEKKD